MFDLRKLLVDVFDPQEGETVTVAVDEPREGVADSPAWRERREMAAAWRSELERLGAERGFAVRPLLRFPATGANNADLPQRGRLAEQEVAVEQALLESTLVLALTQFSATAPLSVLSERKDDFRAASMPGVLRRMEQTALAADYAQVARRCARLHELMAPAEQATIDFSTGHRCWFDLRHRRPEVDDGSLPRFKPGDRVINLPSGETFEVPYEGERAGDPSRTAGTIPVVEQDETVLFHVAGNRVRAVEGGGPRAAHYRTFFAEDPARANVAELAFGVNDKAVVTGVVIEDEKAGFHWAFGRSDHLGGVTGVAAFSGPATVVHQDIVYARDNPVQVRRAVLRDAGGREHDVIRDGDLLV
jgi:leucyl aminopeptidase (aminopeptidase T)